MVDLEVQIKEFTMISKELLSEVLGCDCCSLKCSSTTIHYEYKFDVTLSEAMQKNKAEINIYEMAHKCKEWAMQVPYIADQLAININRTCLQDKFKTNYWCVWILNSKRVSPEFYAETEPEAVFEACEWILKNKG